jgi:uncharacterized damage-inducible protein DinB
MLERKLWVEREFEYGRPAWKFPLLLERLRGTPARVDERVLDLEIEQLTTRLDDKWSILETIGHLVKVEELWLKRLDDYDAGLEELTAADMSNASTNEADFNTQPVFTVLKSFRNVRLDFVSRLEGMDEASIIREALHPRLKQPMNVIDLMDFAASHDDHHLATITQLIATLES